MKEALLKHASDILFSLDMNDALVKVYDCEHEDIPQFITLNDKQSYICVVCLDIETNIHALKRLENILSKDIFSVESEGKTYLFWLEEKIFDDSYKYNDNNYLDIKNTTFKTHTRLSKWIDSYIYDTLNATYNPDYVKYSYNLDRTKEEVLVYLGTYFPRSYAEAFCILNNLLQNSTIFKEFLKKEEIKILSIGCGTGGDLAGLLTALSKKLPALKVVNIKAFDGNIESLSILTRLLTKFSEHVPFRIEFNVFHRRFEPRDGRLFLEDSIAEFDFVVSFKMISEFISRYDDLSCDAYYRFCKEILQYLNNNGICILLDVTIQKNKEDGQSSFIPELLNFQVNKALSELVDFKSLLPLPCNFFEKNCKNTNCFSQKKFSVSHKMRHNDTSKVTYRVILKKQFCDTINKLKTMCNKNYFIGKIQKQDCIEFKECLYTPKNVEMADGYNLSE